MSQNSAGREEKEHQSHGITFGPFNERRAWGISADGQAHSVFASVLSGYLPQQRNTSPLSRRSCFVGFCFSLPEKFVYSVLE